MTFMVLLTYQLDVSHHSVPHISLEDVAAHPTYITRGVWAVLEWEWHHKSPIKKFTINQWFRSCGPIGPIVASCFKCVNCCISKVMSAQQAAPAGAGSSLWYHRSMVLSHDTMLWRSVSRCLCCIRLKPLFLPCRDLVQYLSILSIWTPAMAYCM